ncbi:Protein DMP5 [Linum perenne]
MSSLRPRPVSSSSKKPDSDPTPSDNIKLPPPSPPATAATQQQRTLSQRAISQTLTTTANLANLLPTGTLLAFHLLTPIFTNNGSCDAATRPLTTFLLCLLAASCFLASFTDSVLLPNSSNSVYYGLATWRGIFLFDCPHRVSDDELKKYRIRFVDWVHAVLSVLVFVAVAMRDRNVVGCFYPVPGREEKEVLDIVPVGIGVVCSLLFVVFPTRRHGIGYPVTPAAATALGK